VRSSPWAKKKNVWPQIQNAIRTELSFLPAAERSDNIGNCGWRTLDKYLQRFIDLHDGSVNSHRDFRSGVGQAPIAADNIAEQIHLLLEELSLDRKQKRDKKDLLAQKKLQLRQQHDALAEKIAPPLIPAAPPQVPLVRPRPDSVPTATPVKPTSLSEMFAEVMREKYSPNQGKQASLADSSVHARVGKILSDLFSSQKITAQVFHKAAMELRNSKDFADMFLAFEEKAQIAFLSMME